MDFVTDCWNSTDINTLHSLVKSMQNRSMEVNAMYGIDVKGNYSHYSSGNLADEKFTNFSCSRYETYVTFEQANRPSGNVQKCKQQFKKKDLYLLLILSAHLLTYHSVKN